MGQGTHGNGRLMWWTAASKKSVSVYWQWELLIPIDAALKYALTRTEQY